MSGETSATEAREPSGVTLARARERRARLDQLSCDLHLKIPRHPGDPIAGTVTLAFNLRSSATPLVVDFAPAATHLRHLTVNGAPSTPAIENGHVIVPAERLRQGANQLTFDFMAGDGPLNRRDGLLYSLFVPARASHALPCFDQPDVKGRWRISLELPADWHAVANTAGISDAVDGAVRRVDFAPTLPLPTYLVAFAAGCFSIEHVEHDEHAFRIFHLEPSLDRISRNRTAIASRHARALEWLSDYTGIPYPFGKLDIVAIPSFQFTGMEHPGAILYDADVLLLDEAASERAHARRADVIAHETAHMWFGNLVTMPWFDDVWMKEVLASFMAARIVGGIDERDEALRFFVQHYPPAYDVDRTAGARPIRQPLDNLDEAGLMYGATLYHKAPIAMRQLERLVGADILRDALRAWLSHHAFGNAGWSELAAEFAGRTDVDLTAWTYAWIESAGRPTLAGRCLTENADRRLVITQRDDSGNGLVWPQKVDVACGVSGRVEAFDVPLVGREATAAVTANAWSWVLPGGCGLAYGLADLDDESLAWLVEHAHTIDEVHVRAAALVATWDAMLQARTSPSRLYRARVEALGTEASGLVQQLLFDQTRKLFWLSMSDHERQAAAGSLEDVLRSRLDRPGPTREKGAWFAMLQAIALRPATLDWLLAILEKRARIDGLPLGEADDAHLAAELALRRPEDARALMVGQIARCRDGDRRQQLRFVAPALSPDAAERAAWSSALRDPVIRQREAWVVEALGWIHHPLRATESVPLIGPALDLLSDVHRTGDIFYPQRWVTAVLGGHRSQEAAAEVSRFLLSRPAGYSPRLRALILTAADDLLRRDRVPEIPC